MKAHRSGGEAGKPVRHSTWLVDRANQAKGKKWKDPIFWEDPFGATSKVYSDHKTYFNDVRNESTEYAVAKGLAKGLDNKFNKFIHIVGSRGLRSLPWINMALSVQDGYQGYGMTKDRYGDNPTIGQYATSTVDGIAHGLSFGLIPEGAVVDLGKNLYK